MIKKGTLVLVSMGADMDDYGPGTLYRAKQDFDPDELLKKYLREYSEKEEKSRGKFILFMLWLENKVLAPVPFTSLSLGAYGIFGIEVEEIV